MVRYKRNKEFLKKLPYSSDKVLGALFKHRIEGGNFSGNNFLVKIGKEAGVTHKKIMETYNKNKELIETTFLLIRGELPSLLEVVKQYRKLQ